MQTVGLWFASFFSKKNKAKHEMRHMMTHLRDKIFARVAIDLYVFTPPVKWKLKYYLCFLLWLRQRNRICRSSHFASVLTNMFANLLGQ